MNFLVILQNRALVVGKDYSCHVAKEVLHNLSVV